MWVDTKRTLLALVVVDIVVVTVVVGSDVTTGLVTPGGSTWRMLQSVPT